MDQQAAPGWYPDPTGRNRRRFWDGGQWTRHVDRDGARAEDDLDGGPAALSIPTLLNEGEGAPGATPPARSDAQASANAGRVATTSVPPTPTHLISPLQPSSSGPATRGVTLRLWQLAAGAVVLLLAGVGIGGVVSRDNGTGTVSVLTQPGTTEAAMRPPTTVTPATTTSPATTTAAPPTTAAPTTTRPPTTTAPPVSQADFGPRTFDPNRERVLSVLQSDKGAFSWVRSVDKFVYDPAAGVVILEITNEFSTAENKGNSGWDIVKSVAQSYWMPGRGLYTTASFTPGFIFINSGSRHRCDAGMMLRIANAEASRSEWEASCR